MADEIEQKKPWEQLSGEPDAAYTRFLIYRNLGPARSLDAAYRAFVGSSATKRAKTQAKANGQWTKDSAQWNWDERARAWDIALLSQMVPEAAVTILNLINETARVALETLKFGKLKPRTWNALSETVTILASFISPETIKAAIDNTRVGVPESNPTEGGKSEP